MDSLTQIVLGATVQGIGLGKYQGKKALAYGAILGTLPDLDVLVRYADPVSQMTFHRGITHSLLFLPLLAFFLAWVIKKRWPQTQYTFNRLFWTICLALITHPLLDAFTVYGTQLFWPFAVTPQQWRGVFIVDPIYTLPMLIALVYVLIKGMTKTAINWLTITCTFGCVYLLWGTFGSYYHANRFQTMLAKEGISTTRAIAVPSSFNTLLFRVVAQKTNGDYIDGVSGWFDSKPPEYIVLPQNNQLAHYLDQNDALYQRLNWFSDGWLIVQDINHQAVVTDLRMGVPGFYNFRFVMAKENPLGQWYIVTPTKYDDMIKPHFVRMALKQLWPRIWSDKKPLPLNDWLHYSDSQNNPNSS